MGTHNAWMDGWMDGCLACLRHTHPPHISTTTPYLPSQPSPPLCSLPPTVLAVFECVCLCGLCGSAVPLDSLARMAWMVSWLSVFVSQCHIEREERTAGETECERVC
uniref:Uncharacterized protein n=1 Tax=Vitrella brassicaformis TaxID=1169539 RepID=A0A7S1PB91_9ALVE|mmetsp:Transcript_35022/g.100745  ORF Transcript_35022/g.100745 Transcript_35022/m.100745 type:complete len:107 (+) Transcript_35022:648-968(+)